MSAAPRWILTVGLLAVLGFGIASESRQLRAWFARRAASRAYYAGDSAAALAGYERVRALLPGDPASHTDMADTICEVLEANRQGLEARGEYDALAARAAGAYLDAIRVAPPSAWSYAGLSSLAGTLAERNRRERGVDLGQFFAEPPQVLSAEERLQEAAMLKAVELEPRNYYYHDFLGQFYWTHGLWDRAQAHVREAVRLQPVLHRHFYLSDLVSVSPRVLTAVEQGVEDALDAEGSEVPPEDVHRLLAEVYLRLGDADEARAHFAAAAEYSANPYLFEIKIGRSWVTEGDDEQALRHFTRATELAPDYFRGWLELGLTLSRLGRPEEAIEALRRARGIAPLEYQPSWHLAAELERNDRGDEAVPILEALIRSHPEQREAYLELIDVSLHQGSVHRAVDVARRLVERFPDEPLFREQLRQLESLGQR